MTEWRFVHIGSENDGLELGGLTVWREEWREGVEPLLLSDPADPSQTHRLGVYEIGPAGSPVRFAAGEFSTGIWGFFIPGDDWRYRVVDIIPAEGSGKIILLAGPTDLPPAAEVAIRLKMPDGAVVDMTGMKAWGLPVDGPPFEQDAFLLPDLDWAIPKGALAIVTERTAEPETPATGEEPPSLLTPEPAFVDDDLLRVEVGAGDSAAGELRAPLSLRERAHIAAIGNAGLSPVIAKSVEAAHASREPDQPAEPLLPIGERTMLALWFAYLLSAIFVIFRLKEIVVQLMGLLRVLRFFGETPRDYEYAPLIWMGGYIFYLAIVPVIILKLDRLRRIQV